MIKNWAVKSCILLLVFFGFSGCASLPRPDEMKAEVAAYQLPKLPENGKAIVYVVFMESWYKGISFDVYLDNQEPKSKIGSNMGGQYIYFNLTPGEHKILSKAENWAEITVLAKAGDILFVRQEPYTGFLNARNKLLSLQDYEGKYHVKTSTIGAIINQDQPNLQTVTTQARLEQSANTPTDGAWSQFKTLEVKRPKQAAGLALSQEFLNFFYNGLCEGLVKAGVAGQVVNEGSAVADADAANSIILEGKIIEYKSTWYAIILKSEIKLYRRSDKTLIKTITPEVGAKASPLNTDKNVGENTGKRTADEIKKAMN
jgi:hypothetical protein